MRIRGLALLDDVALEFEGGMNVLTGETGAGKSIIVDALSLLRGVRGRAELVREGEEAARVEAQFAVRDRVGERLAPLLEEHGLELDEGALVLERRVKRSGRGRAAAQSNLTTLAVLAELGGELIEICSQHEHHSLTHVGHHLELLDDYAELGELVEQYAARYRSWRELCEHIADIRDREAERLQRADYLRFQIEELERVAPEPGEHDALERRLGLLRAAHKLIHFAADARERLYERDDAISSQLAVLADRARRLPEGLDSLRELAEQLEAAQIACDEAAAAAGRLADDIEFGPGELEQVEERAHELGRLRRKHGCDVDELIERLAAMREELDGLEGAEDRLAALELDERGRRRECEALADTLHERRAAAGEGLARAIEAELAALHIPAARLAVELSPLGGEPGKPGDGEDGGERADEGVELGPRGRDRAELRFSANPGEPLASLAKVASGGELSRVLLAVKSVLAGDQRVATYVFDEVDAGVGGAVAEAIGQRLRWAASGHQVLCITHLPQIAAFADAHFRVQKQVVDGRTVTRVVRLGEEERVEELARMLGGKRVTQSAREHAKALLEAARRAPTRRAGKSGGKAAGKSAAKGEAPKSGSGKSGSGKSGSGKSGSGKSGSGKSGSGKKASSKSGSSKSGSSKTGSSKKKSREDKAGGGATTSKKKRRASGARAAS
nr:DNA repair protein RecN [Pseudenhygromyxa sp. WMMC2535]